jgi:hypothetical protein
MKAAHAAVFQRSVQGIQGDGGEFPTTFVRCPFRSRFSSHPAFVGGARPVKHDLPNTRPVPMGSATTQTALADEIDVYWIWNQAALMAHGEKLADGFFPIFAVIERALVYIHADEAVG